MAILAHLANYMFGGILEVAAILVVPDLARFANNDVSGRLVGLAWLELGPVLAGVILDQDHEDQDDLDEPLEHDLSRARCSKA